jgi:hypothetical protein
MGGEYDSLMMQAQDQANGDANWQQGASRHIPGVPRFEHPKALSTTPFPGHLHSSGHFSVNRSKLSSVVGNMNKDHGRLTQDASSFVNGAIGSDGTGDWETAADFGANAFNAYTALSGYFEVLSQNYSESVSRLRKNISTYEDAESDITAHAHSVSRNA